jgi:putative ABC transport system permease protein
VLGGCALGLAGLGIAGLLPEKEAFGGFSIRVVSFFLSGFLGLAAGQFGFAAWLASMGAGRLGGRGVTAAIGLGVRNASRQRLRSVLTVGMIATATFLIVAIAAGKKDPAVEAPVLASGNGGYMLVGESDVPLLHDVASEAGRVRYNLDDPESRAMWSKVRAITPFRVNPGENASCLNIYQTAQPTILGVTRDQIARGGFKFIGVTGNPWELLEVEDPDGVVPVFGDLNTLQYSLHVGPGAVIELRDGGGKPFKARIAGMLDSSVFQGVLLMSERAFQQRFPDRAGFQYVLVDVAEGDAGVVSDWLESKFAGLDLDRVGDRLAGFLAVQNTYLSTFQALGGLGLILGTFGLGTILLRNVLERRSEIALLKAVGFGGAEITAMILAENSLLLLAGLGLGSTAALVAMGPHLLTNGADVAWPPLVGQLLLVAVVGTFAAVGAVRVAGRLPIVRTLRAQ